MPGSHLDGSESRKQIVLGTHEPQRGQISNIETIYIMIQPQNRCTHRDTHTEQVIRQLTAAEVRVAAAQKSARQQLILPM